MFERFKRNDPNSGTVATADRPADDRQLETYSTTDDGRFVRDDGGNGVSGRQAARDIRARQREEFGGLNWGAAFFGWLVAVGIAVILLAILSAAGTAFRLSEV